MSRLTKKLQQTLSDMKQRCYNQKHNYYKHYGARGITICDEWLNNSNSFYQWSLDNGVKENLSIDRIDVNGNYEPSNCRWVDNKVQANNRRNNRIIEGKTLLEISLETKIAIKTICYRYDNGCRTLKEITKPVKNYKQKLCYEKAVEIRNKYATGKFSQRTLALEYEDDEGYKDWVIELYQTIKQDLERLELIEALYNKSLKEIETIKNDDRELYLKFKQLENENEQLKQQRDSLAINNGELVVKVADLQKENQELKEKSVKAVGFVKLLIDNISNKKLNDDRCSITNIKSGEEYGNLKEYITKMFKIIWDIDIKWLH